MILTENDTLFDGADVATIVELAVTAEAAGVDSVMLSEHVVLGPEAGADGLPSNLRGYAAPGNQNPEMPWPASLIVLAGIASRTSRIRLVAGAVITALRHPLLLAKELATLDRLSAGRLVVLPTVSWHRQEYGALGVDFSRRGQILDEQLLVWEKVWAGGAVSHHGRHFRFDEIYVEPRAWRADGPRLWFGGSTLHPGVIRRLVRHGHGFNPFGAPTADGVAQLSRALSEAGRSLGDLELVGGVRADLPRDGGRASLDQALETVPAQVAAGYRTICVKPSMFIDRLDEYPGLCAEVVERLGAMDDQP
jgi:alkanesulfonate monooxygenase SsuD/methylene tetrahydromethanopterin reductase-like flavin-dependent oxidoreductase (luciferase family)